MMCEVATSATTATHALSGARGISVIVCVSLTYHRQPHDGSEEPEMEHYGSNEEEEEAARLGGVQEAEVGGDDLGHLLEVRLVAAQHARQQHHVARQHARGDVSGGEDGQQRDDDHEHAQAQVDEARVEDHLGHHPAAERGSE